MTASCRLCTAGDAKPVVLSGKALHITNLEKHVNSKEHRKQLQKRWVADNIKGPPFPVPGPPGFTQEMADMFARSGTTPRVMKAKCKVCWHGCGLMRKRIVLEHAGLSTYHIMQHVTMEQHVRLLRGMQGISSLDDYLKPVHPPGVRPIHQCFRPKQQHGGKQEQK